jgi:hypothetical protein
MVLLGYVQIMSSLKKLFTYWEMAFRDRDSNIMRSGFAFGCPPMLQSCMAACPIPVHDTNCAPKHAELSLLQPTHTSSFGSPAQETIR